MDWNIDYRYKLLGKVIHANDEYLIAFDLNASEIYQRTAKDGGKPKTARTPVFPAGWKDQFGLPYHEHQKSLQINIFDGYAIYGIKVTQYLHSIWGGCYTDSGHTSTRSPCTGGDQKWIVEITA